MFMKAMAMASGVMCAAAFSQFPEYSQQYTQRLAGAVDELSGVVQAFDADAAGLGLTRDAALDQMTNARGMSAARANSMRRVFDRHDRLSNDLNALKSKAVTAQAAQIWRMTDLDVAQKAWADFKPAVPVSSDGIGFGIAGFLAGLGVMGALGAVLRRMTGRARVQP